MVAWVRGAIWREKFSAGGRSDCAARPRAASCSLTLVLACWVFSAAGGLLFGGNRRVFGSGVGDRRVGGEGVATERGTSVERAGGLRGPGGALLGCLVVLTTTQLPSSLAHNKNTRANKEVPTQSRTATNTCAIVVEAIYVLDSVPG